MNDKYDVFIKLLNFLKHKYTQKNIFQDFVSLFAISLSNKVYFNKKIMRGTRKYTIVMNKKNNIFFMPYHLN